jgi:hypothetical protein
MTTQITTIPRADLTDWTLVLDDAALDAALELARGSYQEGLLLGRESLSGSTLRGEARRWSGRYAESRRSLLGRMSDAGIAWCEATGPHGRRVLVVGASAVEVAS